MTKAFKFRAQAIFNLLEKTHSPGSQNLSSRIFSSLSYIISTKRNYIHKKLDTNSCFAKLKAISNLFSFFCTHCIVKVVAFKLVICCHHGRRRRHIVLVVFPHCAFVFPLHDVIRLNKIFIFNVITSHR
jgi:hypothetical protein